MSAASTAPGRAIARGAAAGWLQVGVALVAGSAYLALVLGALPREEAGFWLVVSSLSAYFGLFDLGLGPTLTRFVAFSVAPRGEPTPADGPFGAARALGAPSELFRTACRLYLALATALLVVGLLAGPWLFTQLSDLALDGARRQAWTLFVVGCAANVLASPFYAAATGLGYVAVHRLALAGAQTLGLAASAVLLGAGWGLRGLAIAWVLHHGLLLSGGILFWSRCRELRGPGRWRADVARAFLGPSLQWSAINVGGVMILASGPLIVARQLGVEAVPLYAVLRQLAETMYVLALVPAHMSEPFVARCAAAGDRAGVVAILRRNVRVAGTLMLVGAIVGAVLGREVVAAWVGMRHFAGYVSLWLMLLLYVLEAHHVTHAMVVMATGRVAFARVAIVAGVATVLAGIGLARPWGVAGVVAGMLLAQLATNTWYVPWFSLRHLSVSWSDYVRWLRPLALPGVVTLALALGARALLLSTGIVPGLGAVLGTVALVGALVVPFAWRGALSSAERGELVRGWRRARAGA